MSTELPPGLYEQLITAGIQAALQAAQDDGRGANTPLISALHAAEAADRIAFHLKGVIEQSLKSIPEKERLQLGIRIAGELIAHLDQDARIDLADDIPTQPGQLLHAVRTVAPDGKPRTIDPPLIPLLDTTLLTNAPGEPNVGKQLRTEIESADSIDIVMAFIRKSGISRFQEALARHCGHGRPLRVLTTTYTNSTERSALDLLQSLGADVRVSYDVSSTRLHAKAWLFQRHSGYSTAYIGSSNLTHSAQVTGQEWNVRVSGARNPDVIHKIRAVFDTYWEGGDFRSYNPDEFDALNQSVGQTGPHVFLSPLDIRPEPFQERLLDQLTLARGRDEHRNLLVAATGTGKTVMAALDYARLCEHPDHAGPFRPRLLFVAHRKEILDQSHATFRHVLRDTTFGEQWIGQKRPVDFNHVFASVQSLRRADLANLAPDHFAVVIVDEFHHAAASSYERLLYHLQPKELLGLTATPERSDGRPILDWFGGKIAAELRLWDAIDQHYLTPFAYYGIHDGLDMSDIPWTRGRGYDIDALTNLYTATDVWAHNVVDQVAELADNPAQMRALGFCVSVEHARYMTRIFAARNIRAVAIWGDTAETERDNALKQLAAGTVQVVFSVDLFNEGIDVPRVDTLLMLRPTESPTLFLQQLGRGLRRARNKTTCVVLDFVGHHRKEFRFDRKLRALFGGTRKDLTKHITGGFPFLPAGCHMELDSVAQDIVLRSIRSSIPSNWPQKAAELAALAAAGHEPSLHTFLEHSGLDLEDVYTGNKCWSDLLESASLDTHASGPSEVPIRRAIGRLLHVDDHVRLSHYTDWLNTDHPPDLATVTERERRLLRMLAASLSSRVVNSGTTLKAGLKLIWQHPQVRHELCETFELLRDRIDHVHQPLHLPEVPLQIHAQYTRLEILAAFEASNSAYVPLWQTGVHWLPDAQADLFAFTLNKTSGSFSPTTRYRDYAISHELIHWESQSVTTADGDTGQRYQHHKERGISIMMFARLQQTDRAFWFLGPATYVKHEGERPMAMTWRLQYRLPGDLFTAFAAAVA